MRSHPREESGPSQGSSAEAAPGVVRLSVNLAPSVAEALKTTAAAQGLTLTEATRRAVALLKLVTEEQAKGNRVVVLEGDGPTAYQREIVLL